MSLVKGDWRLREGALDDTLVGCGDRSAILAAVTGVCLLSADPSCASGFAIREQSASALGNAYAGSTAAASYRPTPSWVIRLGAAHDQSPVPKRTRTPRVPDSDRYWLSVGASHSLSDAMTFTIGYAHIMGPDASVNLKADQQVSAARGNLSGDVDASVDVVGLQFQWAL